MDPFRTWKPPLCHKDTIRGLYLVRSSLAEIFPFHWNIFTQVPGSRVPCKLQGVEDEVQHPGGDQCQLGRESPPQLSRPLPPRSAGNIYEIFSINLMKYFPGLVESKAEDDQVGWKLTENDMKIWTIKLIGQLSYAIETHLNGNFLPFAFR